MPKRIIEYIKELSPLFRPSTREEEVQQWLYRKLKNDTEVCGDALGNRLKKATATIVIGIPSRYMHTACEIVDTRDLAHARRLVVELLRHQSLLNSKSDLIPWK